MLDLIGHIVIIVWLLCWWSLTYISYKHGLTPLDAIADVVKRII